MQEAAYSPFKYMMTLAVGAALPVKAHMLLRIMQQPCTRGQPCSAAVSGGPLVVLCALEVAGTDAFADSNVPCHHTVISGSLVVEHHFHCIMGKLLGGYVRAAVWMDDGTARLYQVMQNST